ncbi:MAG TPA: hypothetical protein VJ875_21295 [Pyrinomonadaceae bacterium]|nr:hypothetical protein [Pyrinomonadaceae bacterium]
MKRIVLPLLLTLSVFITSTPVIIAQNESTEYDRLVAQFESELTSYASTHTEAEVIDYVNMRIDQMAYDALGETSTLATISSTIDALRFLNPRVPIGVPRLPSDRISTFTLYFDDGDPYSGGESNFQYCLNTRNEECRRQYNADLFASAAAASAIFAGCVGLTLGTGLIACAAAALAVHALGIAAANERYQGCLTRAYSDCRLTYGGK